MISGVNFQRNEVPVNRVLAIKVFLKRMTKTDLPGSTLERERKIGNFAPIHSGFELFRRKILFHQIYCDFWYSNKPRCAYLP